MRAIIRGLANDNGTLRGLTGQGEPGLWSLLGGTAGEENSDSLQLGGGAGQVSATSRIARASGDIRLASVASGVAPPSTGPVGGPPSPVRPPPERQR